MKYLRITYPLNRKEFLFFSLLVCYIITIPLHLHLKIENSKIFLKKNQVILFRDSFAIPLKIFVGILSLSFEINLGAS